jgi:hypothetical protein
MRAPDPDEDLELEEAIERIRRRERRRRKQRRRLAAVGVLVMVIVLVAGAWLVLRGQLPTWSLRMAQPTSASSGGAAPSTPGPQTRDAPESAPAAAEPATAPEAPYIGAATAPPEPVAAPAPQVERALPPRTPPAREARAGPPAKEDAARSSMREDAPSLPARALPRAPEGKPLQPQPSPPDVSALPSRAGLRSDGEVRVEIATEPLADGLTRYTVRLRERDGRPVVDATVSIRGRRADGALLEAMLDRSDDPGAYHAVVRRPPDLTDARLRVASVDRVQEVPLPDAPR